MYKTKIGFKYLTYNRNGEQLAVIITSEKQKKFTLQVTITTQIDQYMVMSIDEDLFLQYENFNDFYN